MSTWSLAIIFWQTEQLSGNHRQLSQCFYRHNTIFSPQTSEKNYKSPFDVSKYKHKSFIAISYIFLHPLFYTG